MKRVDGLQPRKLRQYGLHFVCKRFLRVLDFSGIERSDSRNFKAGADDGGETSLCAAEDNVEQICARWHRLDVPERS